MENGARSVVLVALFLRGLPGRGGASPRQWPAVLDVLRRAGVAGSPPECPEPLIALLNEAGMWQAAVCLGDRYRWGAALDLVDRGLAFSAEDALYPPRWREGGRGPAAVWRRPGRHAVGSEFVTVVGSRQLDRSAQAFARRAGEVIAESGATILSGGAVGADRIAVQGALAAGGAGVELLACGFHHAPRSSAEQWSLVAPGEVFSTALAMERNLLLYTGSARSLVVHARFRQGGSWHGAVAALRGRVTSVFVREAASGEPDVEFVAAQRALVALGAQALPHPEELLKVPVSHPHQPMLAWGA